MNKEINSFENHSKVDASVITGCNTIYDCSNHRASVNALIDKCNELSQKNAEMRKVLVEIVGDENGFGCPSLAEDYLDKTNERGYTL